MWAMNGTCGGSLALATFEDKISFTGRISARRWLVEVVCLAVLAVLTGWSAIAAKDAGLAPAFVALEHYVTAEPETDQVRPSPFVESETIESVLFTNDAAGVAGGEVDELMPEIEPTAVRWFNGRPVRPGKTMWMKVTGYSPDERSCGKFADGKTATLHSVWTNGMKLVAADTTVLPFGSMVSIPGYDSDDIVPVLDRGGAIKGSRLDLLFPTHKAARQWGVRNLPVTVWEYADGKPAEDPRKLR